MVADPRLSEDGIPFPVSRCLSRSAEDLGRFLRNWGDPPRVLEAFLTEQAEIAGRENP